MGSSLLFQTYCDQLRLPLDAHLAEPPPERLASRLECLIVREILGILDVPIDGLLTFPDGRFVPGIQIRVRDIIEQQIAQTQACWTLSTMPATTRPVMSTARSTLRSRVSDSRGDGRAAPGLIAAVSLKKTAQNSVAASGGGIGPDRYQKPEPDYRRCEVLFQ